MATTESSVDNTAPGPQNDEKSDVKVASDGNRFLVVWSSDRYLIDQGGHWSILGSLVEPGGDVRSPSIFAISDVPGMQLSPVVSWNGATYLVMWRVLDDTYSGGVLCGAFVDRDGNVVGKVSRCLEGPFTINAFGYLALGWNGTHHLLAWKTQDGLKVARIAPDGQVVDPSGIVAANPGTMNPNDITVASDGKDFLVAWTHDNKEVYAARISADGKVLDGPPLQVCPSTSSSRYLGAAAWGKGSYLVTWHEPQNDGDIFGTRIDSSGSFLDGACGKPLLAQAGQQIRPSLIWNGQAFALLWTDAQPVTGQPPTAMIRGTLLDGTATAANPTGSVIMTSVPDTIGPLAWNGSNYLLLWGQPRNDGSTARDWFGSRLDGSLAMLDQPAHAMAVGPREQTKPVIASNGNGYLVAWQDRRTDESDIVAARLDANGAPLDAAGIVVQTLRWRQDEISVAWDGEAWVVAWLSPASLLVNQGSAFLQYARIGPAGTVLPPGVVELPNFQGSFPVVAHPAAASWSLLIASGQTTGGKGGIRAFRIGHDGKLMDSAPADVWLPPASEGAGYPSAACRETECLVAWQFFPSSFGAADIKATRIGSDGKPIDAVPAVITSAPDSQFLPSVAWDGNHYLVAWSDFRTSDHYDIYGALVGPDGKRTSADDLLLVTSPRMVDGRFRMAWSGLHHLLVWEATTVGKTGDGTHHIYGTRIGTDGIAVDAAPVLLIGSRFDDSAPTIAAAPSESGRAFVAYARFDEQPGVLVNRVKVRALEIVHGGVDAGSDSGVADVGPASPDLAWRDSGAREAEFVDAGAAAPDVQPDRPSDAFARLDSPGPVDVHPDAGADLVPDASGPDLADDGAPDGHPDTAADRPSDTSGASLLDARIDGPSNNDAPSAKSASTGCGCSTAPRPRSTWWLVLAAGLLTLLGRNKRRPGPRRG